MQSRLSVVGESWVSSVIPLHDKLFTDRIIDSHGELPLVLTLLRNSPTRLGLTKTFVEFAKDLLIDPFKRNVSDVKHIVQAAASSTSVHRAQKFLEEVGAPSTASAYGSYEELVAVPNVDVVYVATPHSHHFDNCFLVLRAGKHLVCEKPFTVNAAQLKILVDISREKGVFMMEEVWTRFFPLSVKIRELLENGEIGDVKRVTAETNSPKDMEKSFPDGKHRLVTIQADLAGGALLDLGIYSLTWVYQCLYHTLPASEKATSTPAVIGAISHYEPTGIDAENVAVCTFPKSIRVASSSFTIGTKPVPAIQISGTKGEIQVAHPAFRPEYFTIVKDGNVVEKKEFLILGKGLFYQADATARAIRDREKESEIIPFEESLLVMEAMDKVRYDNRFKYPEAIEKTDD
ncbi:dimeric dihydrodiol dehydrogenase [Trichophaea hybrida]|nr:dimeric dihydrodiol dehydrogenase [Trichophaea hybrida]